MSEDRKAFLRAAAARAEWEFLACIAQHGLSTEQRASLDPRLFALPLHQASARALLAVARPRQPAELIELIRRLLEDPQLALTNTVVHPFASNLLTEGVPECFDHFAGRVHDNWKARERYRFLREALAEEERGENSAAIRAELEEVERLGVGTWPKPRPIPGLPDVPMLSPELLPSALRTWAIDLAERMQCPLEFIAAPAMIAAGALIGRKLGIRPKQHDDWMVIPNLWGCVIAAPSMLKSPALAQALKPVTQIESLGGQIYRDAALEHEQQKVLAEARQSALRDEIKNLSRKGEHASAEARVKEIRPRITGPVRERIIVNDPTIEKLGELMNENPNGLLMMRDELVGWMRSLDRDGHANDRAFVLETWNGNGPAYTYDRIGRGTITIESPCLSVVGGIQPGVLQPYIREAVAGGKGGDGFLQRFQMAVWPDRPTWTNVDRRPDVDAGRAANAFFARVHQLTPEDTEAIIPEDGAIPFLHFSAEAQNSFDQWREGWERRLRDGSEHPAFESHLGKYRSLLPSLALIIHLGEGGTGPVPLKAITLAFRWLDYLESHARRVYAAAVSSGADAARSLLKKLVDRKLPQLFALAEVYRPQWSGLADCETAKAAVELLTALDYLRAIEWRQSAGDMSKRRYQINPRIWENLFARTENTEIVP